MKEITVEALELKLKNGEDIQLIDVREDFEREEFNIGGEHIPMGTIAGNVDRIPKDKETIIYCRSGNRSGQVINYLMNKHGFNNLYNLVGGMLQWQEVIGS